MPPLVGSTIVNPTHTRITIMVTGPFLTLRRFCVPTMLISLLDYEFIGGLAENPNIIPHPNLGY
jgi:hypothetical protein